MAVGVLGTFNGQSVAFRYVVPFVLNIVKTAIEASKHVTSKRANSRS